MDKQPNSPNTSSNNSAETPQPGAPLNTDKQPYEQTSSPAPTVINPTDTATAGSASSENGQASTLNQSVPQANSPGQPGGDAATTQSQTSFNNPSPAASVPSADELNASGVPASPGGNVPAAGQQLTQQSPQQSPSPGSKFRKKLLLSIVAVLLLIASIAGFVFGYYLPNQPENVYSAGLDRTGDIMHELVIQSTEPEQLEALSRMQLTGDMSISSDDLKFEGDVSLQLDETKSNSNLTVTMTDNFGDESLELGLSVITDVADGERLPDIYFQLRGISELGLDVFLPGVSELDNQWVEVSADYLEEAIGSAIDEGEFDGDFSITLEDYGEFMRSVSKNINEYVFTDDEDKSVLQLDEVLGEEEFGDIRTYHYDVSIQRENAHQFCNSLIEDLSKTSIVRDISGEETNFEDAKNDCRDEMDEFIDATDVELWVDRDTRLIHKMRFTDQDNSGNYLELGQRYQGGDELEIFVNLNSDEDAFNSTTTIITNIETNTSTSTVTGSQGGANGYEFSLTVAMEPYHEEIDVERPANTISIEELLEGMFAPRQPAQSTGPMLTPQNEEVGVEFRQSAEAGQQYENGFLRTFSELMQ